MDYSKIKPKFETQTPLDNSKLKEIDEAYVFDVDGVISDPGEKHPTVEGVLDAIANKLLLGEPVTLNTGRSISWVVERVVRPLQGKIQNPGLLQNFFFVGEKGGTWVDFNEKGIMTEHKDEEISVPEELHEKVRQLIEKDFSDTTFFDESKLTMLSTEMIDGFSHEEREQKYRPAQLKLVPKLKELLEEYNLTEKFLVDPTTIATDVEDKRVGKDFGVRRILNWLKSKNFTPKLFIAFGDSKSDISMAEEIYNQGFLVKFVFVGNPSDIDPSKYPFPIIITRSRFERGVEEYLNSR